MWHRGKRDILDIHDQTSVDTRLLASAIFIAGKYDGNLFIEFLASLDARFHFSFYHSSFDTLFILIFIQHRATILFAPISTEIKESVVITDVIFATRKNVDRERKALWAAHMMNAAWVAKKMCNHTKTKWASDLKYFNNDMLYTSILEY